MCNCPNVTCPVHEGSLCPNEADPPKRCGLECEHEHSIGENILGVGITLCKDCGTAYATALVHSSYVLMSDIHETIPNTYASLSSLLGDVWKEGVRHGWPTLVRDVCALSAFLFLIIDHLPRASAKKVSEWSLGIQPYMESLDQVDGKVIKVGREVRNGLVNPN